MKPNKPRRRRRQRRETREEIIDERIKTDPKVARDITKDPDAVYGYSPKENGRLGEFEIDFKNPQQVAKGRKARTEYNQKLAARKAELTKQIEDLKNPGKSLDDFAEKAVENRNQGRIQSYLKDNNLDGLNSMYESNIKTYGRKEGPMLDDFLEKGMTHEEVILGSTKSNKGVDIIFGLWP